VIRHFQAECLMGSSCRMFGEEPLARPMCFPNGALHQSPPVHEGSRDPAREPPFGLPHLGRGSRWRTNPPNRRGRGHSPASFGTFAFTRTLFLRGCYFSRSYLSRGR